MLSLIENILYEYEIYLQDIFKGVSPNMYGFIQRDVTRFPSIESKLEAVNMIEKYRNNSGEGLPSYYVDPRKLVATQKVITSDRLFAVAHSTAKETPPFVVKMNGVYYLLDGHNRVTLALKNREEKIKIRLLNLDGQHYAFN